MQAVWRLQNNHSSAISYLPYFWPMFFNKSFLTLLGFVLLLSCKEETTISPPSNILPHSKMVKVQVDLQLAEALVSNTHIRIDTATFLFHRLKDSIFVKNKIDTAMYRKSYTWYATHIEFMDAIYKEVNDSLAARKSTGNIRF